MAVNREGTHIEVYDTKVASEVFPKDCILYANDPIEVTESIVSGEAVWVKGYSHMSHDEVVYLIPSTAQLDLWRV